MMLGKGAKGKEDLDGLRVLVLECSNVVHLAIDDQIKIIRLGMLLDLV